MRKFLAFGAVVLTVPMLPSYSQRIDPNVIYPNLGGAAGIRADSGAGAKSGPSRRAAPGRSSPGVETRSYYTEENPDLTPEKALQQENGAVQQYSKMGFQLEAKHQWDKAEKVFEYVLKVSAIRDGVGSPKMVPILQHLAVVTSEQGRMREAIGYQERVLGFAKNQPDPLPIINAGVALTKLYLRLPDLDKAESTAQEVYKLSQDTVSVSPLKKQEVAHFYGTLLRKINKPGLAETVDLIVSSKDLPGKDASSKDASSKDASSGTKDEIKANGRAEKLPL